MLTKIDLPTADPEPVLDQMETLFGIDPDTVLWTSAKTGEGVADVFEAIVQRLPAPAGAYARVPWACGWPREVAQRAVEDVGPCGACASIVLRLTLGASACWARARIAGVVCTHAVADVQANATRR